MSMFETPAKINLTLEVLRKRSDGYHEIRSVLQAVSLCDRLTFEAADKVSFQCDNPSWSMGKSLVVRAAEVLKAAMPGAAGATIDITKRIPLSSGLGGDSSDAAAALSGLNQLWQLGIPPGELVRMAATLGSDVPFFLSGGTAMAQGRGEFISPLPAMPHAWVVILVPQVERPEFKTGALYASLNPEAFTDGARTDALVARLSRGEAVRPEDLYNVFENVAFDTFAGLDSYRDEFRAAAGEAVHLAGAGPALYALFDNSDRAAQAFNILNKKGFETYLVKTLKFLEIC